MQQNHLEALGAFGCDGNKEAVGEPRAGRENSMKYLSLCLR